MFTLYRIAFRSVAKTIYDRPSRPLGPLSSERYLELSASEGDQSRPVSDRISGRFDLNLQYNTIHFISPSLTGFSELIYKS